MDNYQKFIHISRYARWNDEAKRRETWEETVQRYIEFFKVKLQDKKIPKKVWKELEDAIIALEVMPSMRCLMTAGKALERDNVAGYNCAFRAIDNPRAFDEILYILTCGTGVGFSVERQFINKLPEVSEEFYDTQTRIVVRDSRIGWATALRELISLLYAGQVPEVDYSNIRAAGEPLKVFGGRASGPGPLKELFDFTIQTFRGSAGRKLNSIECHDIVCKTGEVIVCGGVRRSALLSLSNLSDDRMRRAKTGDWQTYNKQRYLANNSACYTEKPDTGILLEELKNLYDSKSGERGIFNRRSAQQCVERSGRRDSSHAFGTNPCSEIILRSKQFCNLSEVVCRPDDTLKDLERKIRLATILGSIQATLTSFRYLTKGWRENTEEEALLGVSLTGIMDNEVMSNTNDGLAFENFSKSDKLLPEILEELKQVAIDTNKEWSKKLGINQSTAITCVKPSGTVSQLVDSSSGIHPRLSEYYIRRVRIDKKDPLYQMCLDQEINVEDDFANPNQAILSFYKKSPKHARLNADVGSLVQLDLWDIYQKYWCEHKPSCTVYYRNGEFFDVMSWIYNHFDDLSGISFFPENDHVYAQAPYEIVTEEQYKEGIEKLEKQIDFSRLAEYEMEDNTKPNQELACTGGACEI